MRGLFISVLLGTMAGVSSIAVMPFFFAYAGAGFILPGLILLLLSTRWSRAIAFVISAGIVLDSYAFYPMEAHTLRLFVFVLFALFIFTHWLTNRSVYTAVALSVLLTVLDQCLGYLIYRLQIVSSIPSWSWSGVLWVLVFHAVVTALGFLWMGFFTKRLSLSLHRGQALSPYG